ncbi:ABC transporter permease [Roseicitreum antarcticum]|uniref:Peptide/nickel transport system permease protein n=1 Tax=Roseicitreum antarcticum TaxID=564137 RepID=A0A1H3AU99_9RHOB|nr:ABC transporter permease [Roseicitreum antarcticum]SDX33237.1 peptide/nickel transport system permease protein [Roseicitreum antarcticum]
MATDTGDIETPVHPMQLAMGRYFKHPGAVIGLIVLVCWILVTIFAPVLAPYDPADLVGRARQAPSAAHWLGTDMLGRDVLSRVIYGSRISISIGLIAVLLGGIPGVILGLLAGYFGGWVDTVISRFVDALLAFPSILLALVVIAALGASIQNMMIAVGIATLPDYARLVRGTVLSIKSQPYVEAARLVGNSHFRIMARHILINANAPIVVLATLQIGSAILIGAGLSFLGLGAQPPTPEWGLMSAEGRQMLQRAWWISTFPGIAILSVVIACNLVGDGLRSALDPKMRMG